MKAWQRTDGIQLKNLSARNLGYINTLVECKERKDYSKSLFYNSKDVRDTIVLASRLIPSNKRAFTRTYKNIVALLDFYNGENVNPLSY